MRRGERESASGGWRRAEDCCNHPRAVLIDPSARELHELEQMLAKCPICSRWSPGDGPIMAIVPRQQTIDNDGPKELG